MTEPRRLYTATHAPRCRVCHGPMVAHLQERTHPCCDSHMPALMRLLATALRKGRR